jgi:hypothetical protein
LTKDIPCYKKRHRTVDDIERAIFHNLSLLSIPRA